MEWVECWPCVYVSLARKIQRWLMSIHVRNVKAGVSGVLTSMCWKYLPRGLRSPWCSVASVEEPRYFCFSLRLSKVLTHRTHRNHFSWSKHGKQNMKIWGNSEKESLNKMFPKGGSSSSSNLPALSWFWFRTHGHPSGILGIADTVQSCRYLDSSSILPYTSPISLTATLSTWLKQALPVSEYLPSCSESLAVLPSFSVRH